MVKNKSGTQTQRIHENGHDGGGGGTKKPCEGGCGVEKSELNHCVCCAQKLCDSCRTNCVEKLLEDFMSSREEAAALERKIHKKNLRDIQNALDNLKVSENVGTKIIHSAFKDIEKQLALRKTQLLKDLHTRHEEQINPLLEEKKVVERELYFASDKFRDACKISITPVRGEKASSFNKMPDGEFAMICVNTTKAKESIKEFTEIKGKMEEIAAPASVRVAYEEPLEQMFESIHNFAEIEVKDKEDRKSNSQKQPENGENKESNQQSGKQSSKEKKK